MIALLRALYGQNVLDQNFHQRLLSYKPNIARQGSYVSSANFKWFLLGHDKNIEDYFERLFKSSDVSLDKYNKKDWPIASSYGEFIST